MVQTGLGLFSKGWGTNDFMYEQCSCKSGLNVSMLALTPSKSSLYYDSIKSSLLENRPYYGVDWYFSYAKNSKMAKSFGLRQA